jgi:hypothetical protein
MTEEKGPPQKMVDTVGDAVQAVAVGIGLADPEPAITPKSKSVRKSARKAAVAKVEEGQKAVRKARIATHRKR